MQPMDETTLGIDDVLGFGFIEHFLVWSWRRMAAGRVDCPLIAREFAEAFGEDAGEVFVTFCTFLRALGYASRRRLAVGHPGHLALTADERQVLTLVAAAQSDRRDLFDAHLHWLARSDVHHILTIGAGALATALSAHHLYLALPAATAPTMCGRQLVVG